MRKNYLRMIVLLAAFALTLAGCGDSSSGDSLSPGHTHSYGEWSIKTGATCTAKEVQKQTCSCGDEKTREVGQPLGHLGISAIPATCIAKGNTGTGECTRCHQNIPGEETPIDPNAHTPGLAATCTDAQTCTLCHVELNPSLAHDWNGHICTLCSTTRGVEAKYRFTGGDWRDYPTYAYNNLGARTAVIVQNDSDNYSTSMAKFFADKFKKITGNTNAIPATVSYNTGDTDFTDQLNTIRRFNPDVVFAPGNSETTTSFINYVVRYFKVQIIDTKTFFSGKLTLGENTITTTTAGISYTDVYTEGGGSITTWGAENTFAYLYSGIYKIGTVIFETGSSNIAVYLGKTSIDSFAYTDVDTTDMQDDYSGYAF